MKTSSIIFTFLLAIALTGLMKAQAPQVTFKIVPPNPYLELGDTVQFSLRFADGIKEDSAFYLGGLNTLERLSNHVFVAFKEGKDYISCIAYVDGTPYKSQTQVIVKGAAKDDGKNSSDFVLAFNPSELNLQVGATAKLRHNIPPMMSNYQVINSNPKVASFEADGLLKAYSTGITVISVAWGGQLAKCYVKVYGPGDWADSSKVITIEPDPIKLNVGEKTAVKFHSKAMIKAAIIADIVNKEIADFDEAGYVVGKAVGSTQFVVRHGPFEKRTTIFVQDGNPDLSISPNPIRVKQGERAAIKVSSMSMLAIPIELKVANSNIASAGPDYVVGLKVGRTMLFATHGDLRAKAVIEVYPKDTNEVVLPELPVVRAQMILGQTSSLQQLFPRYQRDMLYAMQSNFVVLADAQSNLHAVKRGLAVVLFFDDNKKPLFKGIIQVNAKDSLHTNHIKHMWFTDRSTMMLAFADKVILPKNTKLKDLIRLAIQNKDAISSKSADAIEVLDAILKADRQTLVITLSRELQDGERLQVSMNSSLVNKDETDEEYFQVLVSYSSTKVSEVRTDQATAFPNPTSNFVTVTSKTPFVNIKLFDVQGKLLANKHINRTTRYTIDVNYLKTGTYILLLSDAKNFSSKVKFSKK